MSAGDEEPEVDLVHLAKESHAIRTVAGERHVIARLAALEQEVTAMKNILLRIERHMGGSPSPARDAGTTRVSKWNLLAGIVRAVVEHVNANLARAVQVEEYSLTDANAALLIQKICSVSSDIGSVDVRTDMDYPEWARLEAGLVATAGTPLLTPLRAARPSTLLSYMARRVTTYSPQEGPLHANRQGNIITL